MLPTVKLFSSAVIDMTDFLQFFSQLGGEDGSGPPYEDGYWPRGDQYLSIRRDNSEIKPYSRRHPEQFATVRDLLQIYPQACVVIDFSRTPGSGLFAVEFANALNQRWPVVAVDEATAIYDGPAIARLLDESRGFSMTTTGEEPTYVADDTVNCSADQQLRRKPRRSKDNSSSSTLQRAARRSQLIHIMVATDKEQ